MSSTSTDLIKNFHDRFCTDCGLLLRDMTLERPLACPNEICLQPIPLVLNTRRDDGFFRCKRCYVITHGSFNFCESCGREKTFMDEARLMDPDDISRIIRTVDKNIPDSISFGGLSEETDTSVVRQQNRGTNGTPISKEKLFDERWISVWQGEQTGNDLEDSDIDELLGNLDLGFIENEMATPPKRLMLETAKPVVKLEKVEPVVKQKPSKNPTRNATGQFVKRTPGTKDPAEPKRRGRPKKATGKTNEARSHSFRKRNK